jgi:hypothetical protein
MRCPIQIRLSGFVAGEFRTIYALPPRAILQSQCKTRVLGEDQGLKAGEENRSDNNPLALSGSCIQLNLHTIEIPLPSQCHFRGKRLRD